MAKKRNVWEAFVRRLYYKYFSQNILYELQIRARNEAVDYVQKNMNDAVIFENKIYYCGSCYVDIFIRLRKRFRPKSHNNSNEIYSKNG